MMSSNKNALPLVGVGLGLALFVAVGFLPTMVYGGYASVLLAGGVSGAPVQSTQAVRALIVLGMALGVAAVAALFAVVGAASGAAVRVLTGVAGRSRRAQATR